VESKDLIFGWEKKSNARKVGELLERDCESKNEDFEGCEAYQLELKAPGALQ